MSEGDQMREEVVKAVDSLKPKKRNSPKTSRSTWDSIKREFELGSYLSLQELSDKYKVNPVTLRTRMFREKWNQKQRTLQNKVELVIENKLLKEANEVKSYLASSFERAKRYEKIADASIAQAATNEEGIPLVDPSMLDEVTRSLLRLHELAKSSLRLPSVEMDIKSNGQSLGESFVQAIAKLRESKDAPRLNSSDLSKALDADIVE